jgi:hypothetical protein
MHTIPPYKRITARFKDYNRDIKDVWTSYTFIDSYTQIIKTEVKNGSLPQFDQESLSGTDKKIHKKSITHTYGVADHICKKVNPDRSFVTAVALTEDFLKELMVTVYEEHPEKLDSKDTVESFDRQFKLLNTILSKNTKDDIVDALIEERVRGVFYGNPLDYFTKDKKAKLGFGEHFVNNHSVNLKYFKEITARRNLYAHNNGKVDSKYIREVSDPTFSIGRKAIIDKEYLRHSIIILRGLSAVAAGLIIKNIFKQPRILGTLTKVYTPFEQHYNDSVPPDDRAFRL